MRKLILFLFLLFAEAAVYAQDSYSYSPYGIAFFAGENQPYVDVKQANQGKTFTLAGYYNLSPYIPLGLELQSGDLSGGSIITDPSKRQFNNQYLALFAHADYALGELIDYEGSDFLGVVKDFYAGVGAGMIKNHMKFIQRYNLVTYQYPLLTYRYPGENDSYSFATSLRFGYEFKIYNEYGEPFLGINIQYIHNITFNEELDGYTDPPNVFKNNSPDQYRQIQIGIKLNFGDSKPFIKRINN